MCMAKYVDTLLYKRLAITLIIVKTVVNKGMKVLCLLGKAMFTDVGKKMKHLSLRTQGRYLRF